MKVARFLLKAILIAAGASAGERLWAFAHPHNQAYLGAFMLVMLMLVGVTAVTAQMIRALQPSAEPEVPKL
jgi:hypothetical protein